MSRTMSVFAFMLALFVTGCATPAKKVTVKEAIPEPKQGEVAVFGGIRLVEEIEIFMPNEAQDGSVYLVSESDGGKYRISCFDDGAFGVYLPAGRYKLEQVCVDGYSFEPDIHLNVPASYKAVYAGVVVLDGSPTGVDPKTGDTVFVYTVKDESRSFADALRKESPGAERDVYKSLFVADGAISTGDYPTKVFRAKDIERELAARGNAVEEVTVGGLTVLTYFINPVWLLTIH